MPCLLVISRLRNHELSQEPGCEIYLSIQYTPSDDFIEPGMVLPWLAMKWILRVSWACEHACCFRVEAGMRRRSKEWFDDICEDIVDMHGCWAEGRDAFC